MTWTVSGSDVAINTRAVDQASEASEPELAVRAARVAQSRIKRLIDVIGASLALIAFSPLFLATAILIKLESRGPVFFTQRRYGVGKAPFWIFKFRTMVCMESTGTFQQAVKNDSRITAVGRVLRRTSIDELPQLLNVLRGDMSLVGPRPHAIAMDNSYVLRIPNYRDRHLVRPGMTGLAQIAGYRGPTDDEALMTGRLRFDRLYIARWSPLYDVQILLKTPITLFGKHVF